MTKMVRYINLGIEAEHSNSWKTTVFPFERMNTYQYGEKRSSLPNIRIVYMLW